MINYWKMGFFIKNCLKIKNNKINVFKRKKIFVCLFVNCKAPLTESENERYEFSKRRVRK